MISLTDDIEWNIDNIKLGLFEGQTFDSFDSRYGDALKNEDESNNNSTSFIASQEINQSVNENDLNKENALFTSDNLSNEYIESLKTSLFNSYWELC